MTPFKTTCLSSESRGNIQNNATLFQYMSQRREEKHQQKILNRCENTEWGGKTPVNIAGHVVNFCKLQKRN